MAGQGAWFALALALVGSACTSPAERQEDAFAKAESAAQNGDPARAVRLLQTALARDPRNTRIVARVCVLQLRRGRYHEALELIDDLPRDVPRDRSLQSLRAWALSGRGREEEAVRLLQSLHEPGAEESEAWAPVLDAYASTGATPEDTDPLPVPWRLHLAKRQLDMNYLRQAAAWLVEVPPGTNREPVAKRLFAKAAEATGVVINEDIGRLAESKTGRDALLVRYQHAKSQGDGVTTRLLEEEFLSSYPDDPSWSRLALASATRYLGSGDPKSAMELVSRVVVLEPENVDALHIRGVALRALGKNAQAMEALELALTLDPTNGRVRSALAALRRAEQTPSVVVDMSVRGTTSAP